MLNRVPVCTRVSHGSVHTFNALQKGSEVDGLSVTQGVRFRFSCLGGEGRQQTEEAEGVSTDPQTFPSQPWGYNVSGR